MATYLSDSPVVMTSYLGAGDPNVTKRVTTGPSLGQDSKWGGDGQRLDTPLFGGRSGRKKSGVVLRPLLTIFFVVAFLVMLTSMREGQIQFIEHGRGEWPPHTPQEPDLGETVAEEDKNITEGHPVFGKRKLLQDHEQLHNYVATLSGESSGKAGRKVSRFTEKLNVRIQYIELTPEEETFLSKDKMTLWKDLSGTLYKEMTSSCLSCSVPEVHRNKWGEIDQCDEKRPDKIWCSTWCPFERHCISWANNLREEMNKSGGYMKFYRQSQAFKPYIVIFTGGAYVTENGEVYNDEVVFDCRGHCQRKSTKKIRRLRARKKFTYKKVYVTDHVWRGPYHELADAAARLFFYHKELLADPEIMIHATTDYPPHEENFEIRPWRDHKVAPSQIDIFEAFGINGSRFITGDVYADEVIVSQVHCSSAENLYGIEEMRLGRAIHEHLVSLGYPNYLPLGQGTILVVKRTHRRRITNLDELVEGLQKIAGSKKVEVYDDHAGLTQSQIWGLFYKADLVVAPHGAGLVNLVACRKHAVVHEFIQPAYPNMDPANCNFNFKDLASFMGLTYYADLPSDMHRPARYWDAKENQWIDPPTSMTIDLPTTLRNLQQIIHSHF
ncbi:hypothetical protein CBR_g31104 [Chara braunii]|uniref:Glycosyltransferase 61 catalytic domain-containing protein n=1 Tax=Chara braunii TaxID=69332 RepID=A0A388LEB6_CHABU|nr:hypothetical protein CBR_g31104 [Chara braunii]|eukprot:GBG80644.1 hypothetical protein CBR_g31104 [Chara braunii]